MKQIDRNPVLYSMAIRWNILYLLLLPAIWGCDLFTSHLEVEIRLSASRGLPDSFSLYLPGTDLPEDWDGGVKPVDLPRGSNLPVVACLNGTGICAAGFFPGDVSGRTLSLAWEQGPLGAAVKRLYANGAGIEVLDPPSVQKKIMKAGKGNPWICDMDAVIFSLRYKGRAPAHIPIRGTFKLSIPDYLWKEGGLTDPLIPAIPCMKEIVRGDGGTEVLEGISWFFMGDEACMLQANASGWTLTIPSTSRALSGCW